MKSKLKKLIVAAAVSFVFSAPASAAIGSGEGATLFLEAYDPVSQASYTRDLGVTMNNFGVTGRTAAAGFTNIMNDQVTDAFVSAGGDAAWTSFMSNVANAATVIWDVIASDNAGTNAIDTKRLVFTSLSDVVAAVAGPATWSSNAHSTGTGTLVSHVNGANVLLGANTSAFTTVAGDAGNYSQFKANNLGGGLPPGIGVTSAGLGQSMGFYYATRTTVGSTEVTAAAYKLGADAFQWTLDNAGNLTYGVSVAAVPEPTTWALFAAGALMLGGMARRRLS